MNVAGLPVAHESSPVKYLLHLLLDLNFTKRFPKMSRSISKEREVWVHKHSNLGNYGIGQRIQKEQDEKNLLPKINLLTQINEEIKSPVFSDDSTQIPLKLAGILIFTIQAYFRRSHVESSEHNVAYISWPICTNRLIFNLTSGHFSSCSIWICQPIP